MKKSKSDFTKDKILVEAVNIFKSKGFAASRTSEIAKASEVSEATIFKYYKSKQGILDSIVHRFIESVSTRTIIEPLDIIFEENKNESPDILLRKLFRNRIDLFGKYKDFAMVAITESRFNTGIRENIIKSIYPEAILLGEKIINNYKAQGIFREDLDPFITIRTVMMSLVGVLLSSEIVGIQPTIGSIEKELDLVIDIVLRGALK